MSKKINRRSFLTTAGGLTIGITAMALVPRFRESGTQKTENFQQQSLNAWVHLAPNGEITIYNPAAEMGQGSLTALPVILAEEMDADWSQVRIEASPNDPGTYGIGGGRKIMLTVGSWTVKRYFEPLRQAGAQARYILMHSAAQHWKLPMSELRTEKSRIFHPASQQEIRYGEILTHLQIPDKIPEFGPEQLKKPADFRLIGQVMPRYEIPDKVNGTAQFATDIRLPGMVYGAIERGRVHGAAPKLLNEPDVRAQTGLIEIVPLDYGIGVVADTMERALTIKKMLQIEWNEDVPARQHNSQESYAAYAQLADSNQKGEILNQEGDVENSVRSAAKIYTADYRNDYVYHAQMEPLNAVASVTTDGAEIWAGTQGPGFVEGAVAKVLGIPEEKVSFHPQLLGGGLGRRSLHDYIEEAALLSQAVQKPVKLQWTREDDLQYGHYRPLSLQRMKAGVDQKGQLSGLSHLIVGDGSGLLASGARNEYYAIPNQQVELRAVQNGIRLKHWRSVGHGPNKFAIESFLDEIAQDQGIDPLVFRRQLMASHPRALATLNKAADMARWGDPLPTGRARGMAFGERSGALATGICEISLDRKTGKIRVHHFWAAVDAGLIVQPDNVIAQMEGGIVMGLSSVLTEQITIQQGVIQQANFQDYRLLRMKDIPESIEIAMMPSTEAPQGIGEASTPLVGGAVGNAFAALTGKRLRHLPFTPERVREVLHG